MNCPFTGGPVRIHMYSTAYSYKLLFWNALFLILQISGKSPSLNSPQMSLVFCCPSLTKKVLATLLYLAAYSYTLSHYFTTFQLEPYKVYSKSNAPCSKKTNNNFFIKIAVHAPHVYHLSTSYYEINQSINQE